MATTPPLFDEFKPEPTPASSATALSIAALAQAQLSAAARAFNLQLTRIDKLKSQLEALDAVAQSHRQLVHQELLPLRARHAQAMRDMALLLDQRLDGKALTQPQRETARQMICSLARELAEEGDSEMAALHDKHNPHTLAQMREADLAELREQLEEVLGEPLDAMHEGAKLEDLLAAGMARMREAAQAEQERRRAAADKRKARKKPGAAQAAAHALMDDAQANLRSLFRQLASLLHPDREPDAQARVAKTAMMSEANAAYERGDLVALMQIQQQALGADPQAAARMSDDKLAALTLLLKQQVADLERERASRNAQLAAEFELAPGLSLSARTLEMVLHSRRQELEEDLALMQRDLRAAQEDAGLKRWLSAQRRQAQREMRDLGDMKFP